MAMLLHHESHEQLPYPFFRSLQPFRPLELDHVFTNFLDDGALWGRQLNLIPSFE